VLDAVLERVTYANEETGYTIARVATERSGADLLTVVGSLLGVQPGESLRLVGRWGTHPKYGRQFEVDSFTTVLPATITGIERYLGSGLIKGIGPKMAARIVEHFGADTLRIIEEDPGRLVEVPGLGPKRTAMIGAAWEEQKAIKEVMVFLQGVGVSTSLAVRIYKKYGDSSISVVRNEPSGWPPTCGASGSRPPTRSPGRWASRRTARSGWRPDCSTPCPRPPTAATATCPNPT
jgi:exodeoxyribonuclease V alpha subunit